MITEISIENFKSILSDTIQLANVNVFIGENGSGKTNILEAVAMLSASTAFNLSISGLSNRGIRVTKPMLTLSSFLGQKQKSKIKIVIKFKKEEFIDIIFLYPENKDDIYSEWKKYADIKQKKDHIKEEYLEKINEYIVKYLIYSLSTPALRGISNESREMPLGINGEGVDVLLANFSKEERKELKEYNHLISWLDDIVIDENDSLKFQGHKLGRSKSLLYFRDKFMQRNNNIFAAENANEGILHILFYLVLFISKKTPSFFAIDNIESSLNPKLCRTLMKEITKLAVKKNKQVLITTHNPAILDGLNLYDETQKLFIVKRTDKGYTKTEQIRLKPETKEKNLKLSEMWMRGYLGGLPNNF